MRELLGGTEAFLLSFYLSVFLRNKTLPFLFRFGNYLGKTLSAPSTEPAVIELAAKALARLTQVSGTYTANLKNQLVTHEFKRAVENLQEPQTVHYPRSGH